MHKLSPEQSIRMFTLLSEGPLNEAWEARSDTAQFVTPLYSDQKSLEPRIISLRRWLSQGDLPQSSSKRKLGQNIFTSPPAADPFAELNLNVFCVESNSTPGNYRLVVNMDYIEKFDLNDLAFGLGNYIIHLNTTALRMSEEQKTQRDAAHTLRTEIIEIIKKDTPKPRPF